MSKGLYSAPHPKCKKKYIIFFFSIAKIHTDSFLPSAWEMNLIFRGYISRFWRTGKSSQAYPWSEHKCSSISHQGVWFNWIRNFQILKTVNIFTTLKYFGLKLKSWASPQLVLPPQGSSGCCYFILARQGGHFYRIRSITSPWAPSQGRLFWIYRLMTIQPGV